MIRCLKCNAPSTDAKTCRTCRANSYLLERLDTFVAEACSTCQALTRVHSNGMCKACLKTYGMRECNACCNVKLVLLDFYKKQRVCKVCHALRSRKARGSKSVPAKVCGACQSPDPRRAKGWVSDRCRETGEFRAFLCLPCSAIVGWVETYGLDCGEHFANYLLKHKTPTG